MIARSDHACIPDIVIHYDTREEKVATSKKVQEEALNGLQPCWSAAWSLKPLAKDKRSIAGQQSEKTGRYVLHISERVRQGVLINRY